MSALMPAPQPPEDQVLELLELHAFAAQQFALAVERLRRARDYADDPHATATDRMHTRILVAVRQHETELWDSQCLDLVEKLRARGVAL